MSKTATEASIKTEPKHNQEMLKVLANHNFTEYGGGDDFTSHGSKEGDSDHQIYLHDTDGTWEHHNLKRQKNDDPGKGQGRGKGATSLHKYLSTKFKT